MKTYEERTADVSVRMKKIRRKKRIVRSSVCLSLVVLLLVLFVPYNTNPPSVRQYAASPYYGLIEKINAATFQKPPYRNNFELLVNGFGNVGMTGSASPDDMPNMEAVPDEMPSSDDMFLGTAVDKGEYVEVTDNQVSGVIEADIFKRSTEYVYYLRGNEISVYSIAGEDSCLVGAYQIVLEFKQEVKEGEGSEYYYFDSAEMYLSQDCTALTLVLEGYDSRIGSCATLVSLDVTDPDHIQETNRVYVTGSYLSSRMVDGNILLMSKYRVKDNRDFADESTFLPQVGTPGNMTPVAAEDIIAPEELSSVYYTLVCAIDGNTLEVNDTAAFLSYSDDIYVSNDHIFASRSYTQYEDECTYHTVTEISCLQYSGEALTYKGSVTVEGSLKDQYSMDEYEGILRVVTSTFNAGQISDGEFTSFRTSRNASLYCVSLEDFSVVASVEKFAPENETAESVRFDGSMAYVCTAEVVQLRDPVYFFDLSDLQNITWTDTGTIDGYSSSLINLGEGFLLGIGFGDSWQLKIEVYEEVEDKVISAACYQLDAEFASDYKAYYINRDADIIGLAVYPWDTGRTEYILLHFDGYELNEIYRQHVDSGMNACRAFLADGWFYILGSGNNETDNFLAHHLIHTAE